MHNSAKFNDYSLASFANELGSDFSSAHSVRERKSLGQYMTPIEIAKFMADRIVSQVNKDVIRILEPAAGCGILVSAVIDSILNRDQKPTEIQIVLFELDPNLIGILEKVKSKIKQALKKEEIQSRIEIRNADFLMSSIATEKKLQFDLIISNPPYFKIPASDIRSITHKPVVYGQPNIYGLFMSVCADVLSVNGSWCFITPRSWTNGLYFKGIRRNLFCKLDIDSIHIFESRKDHFKGEILQEAMITWANAKRSIAQSVAISKSMGVHDLYASIANDISASSLVNTKNDFSIQIKSDSDFKDKCLSETLASLGLKVSTGPVIPFRNKELLHQSKSKKTVPLLWMQHVTRSKITWPLMKKYEHIDLCASSQWMLVRNQNLVILRRFSPKEDIRRVTAAPYLCEIPTEYIGIENHLNYIYCPNNSLSKSEAKGLGAYLNSLIVEEYFRDIAGSTQINARELKTLLLPDRAQIAKIGELYEANMSLQEIDQIVFDVLQIFSGHNHNLKTA